MKKLSNIIIAAGVICMLFASCKKDNSNNKQAAAKLGTNFPSILNTIITPAVIDSLQKDGMIINSGLTPPTVNGAYFFHPQYCTFDNSGSGYLGQVIDDYKYNFTSQNSSAFTISVQYEDVVGNDSGSDGSATYISGSGDLFTIFAQSNGVSQGISYVLLQVLSGQVANGSIKNLQIGEYLQSKVGDTGNTVVERVGSTRIFIDQDGNSEATTFSFNLPKVQSTGQSNSVVRTSISAAH